MLPKLRALIVSLLLLQTVYFVSSCKKVNVNLNENSALLKQSGTDKKALKTTVTIEAYNSTVHDSCRNENIKLTGQAEYKLIESFENGYYINYEIKLEKVTGIGEKTGTLYKGGGKIVGIAKLNADFSNNMAKVTYKVKYTGNNGNLITINENARFVMKNNIIKIEFNNSFYTCK